LQKSHQANAQRQTRNDKQQTRQKRRAAGNRRLAQWRVMCFYDSFVGKQTIVLLINISGENRHLRVAAKRNTKYK